MHLLIPFAAPPPNSARDVLRELALPSLAACLAHAGPATRDDGDDFSLSPPHERALARAIGITGGDGALPWAAQDMVQDGREPGDLAWGRLTPVHWHVGVDQITLRGPHSLDLDAPASMALLDAVRELFEQEGFALIYGSPLRWYLAHESLSGLRTASLDRVIGRGIDPWLPRGPESRRWRRLQNEVQMCWHAHPVNAEREARGLPVINSIWLSGCGVHQRVEGSTEPRVDDRLRLPALEEDWAAWLAAWRALDAGPLRELAALRRQGRRVALTLCGERAAAHWTLRAPSWTQRLWSRWRRDDPRLLLETL